MSAVVRIEFERECSKCYGNGYLLSSEEAKPVTCERCRGSGQVATELGEDLLEFLDRQGFVKAGSERKGGAEDERSIIR